MDCIFCKGDLYPDSVYVTDGKVCVCSMCASRHSFYEVAIYCDNLLTSSNLILHRPSVIDYGLNVQTDERAKRERISNCPLGDCDNCHFYYGELDSCMVGEPGTVPTVEDIAKVRAVLGEEKAEHFFDVDPEVEAQHDKDDERAKTYEELCHDIDNMSHEDFFSKYADNPDALHAYVNANGEPADAFMNI